ncbi:MAG TPA: hypothetical protein VMT16_03375 [Thermoanaerobaculia bacterium]|nr:hypothetical protein [Thermoanaerobaculia bacterium]
MSLKAVHVLFITLATALSLGLAWWGWQQVRLGGGGGYLALSVLAVAAAAALLVYGWWFLRKMKDVSYL